MLLDERDRRVTFAGCLAWSERVAAGLAALGVGEGTPFSWQLPTRIDTVVLSVALSRLGAVQNPIIAIYREREVGVVLRQTGAEFCARGARRLARDSTIPRWRRRSRPSSRRLRDRCASTRALPDGDPLDAAPGAARRRVGALVSTRPRAPPRAEGACATPTQSLIAGGHRARRGDLARRARRRLDRVPVRAHRRPRLPRDDAAAGMPRRAARELPMPEHAVEMFRRHGVTISGGSTAFYQTFAGRAAQAAGREDPPVAARARPAAARRCRPRCSGRCGASSGPGPPRLRHDRVPDDRERPLRRTRTSSSRTPRARRSRAARSRSWTRRRGCPDGRRGRCVRGPMV